MNKLTKTVLIIASMLCLVGGVFFVGGLATGGLGKLTASDHSTAAWGGNGKIYSMEKTKLEPFNHLKVNLDTADFILKPSDDDSCYLSYHLTGNKKANPVSYQTEDGQLTLTEQQKSNVYISVNFSFLSNLLRGKASAPLEEEQVVLYVPASFRLEQLDGHLKDGDAFLDGTLCDTMNLTLDYGDLSLKNVQSSTSHITTSDGDVSVTDFSSDKCNLTLNYGDLTMRHSSIKDGAIRIDDGDFIAKDTSFIGKVDVILAYGDGKLSLEKEEFDTLSLLLDTSYGEITVDNLSMDSDDVNHYEKTGTHPEQMLSIRSDDGDIVIKTK
ncbi:MAG: DUF4097 family beta strand repeat-containing protein [Eubacteriales bacterium]|nr:DUF4097 family beta strand repeat-containing protein [Eubacteriales bacterium]